MIGIVVGGGIAFFLLGFLGPPETSQTSHIEPTSNNMPRLIALEPTNIPWGVTPTEVLPTLTVQPSLAPTASAVSAAPTSLTLLNEQQKEVLGYSVAGRPLEVYTFGEGEHERMIIAGIHGGDEWNTVTLANQLIEYLNQNPHIIPEDVTLYILPNLNPDGEARAHNKYGRLNDNGVDLNRNFPVNWLSEWERAGCWNYLPSSGGTGPGSEAETRVLMALIASHQVEALISYHSAALGVFPGGDPPDANSVRLAESIAEVSTYPYPPLDTGCIYSGTLADYAVSRGAAAVDLELTDHIDTDFGMNLNILDILLHWQ